MFALNSKHLMGMAVVLATSLSTGAFAQICETKDFANKLTDFNPDAVNKLTFNKYAGPADCLTKVQIKITPHVNTRQRAENLDPGAAALTLTSGATVTVYKSDFTTAIGAGAAGKVTMFAATGFDGVDDKGGTSGIDTGFLVGVGAPVIVNLVAAADLAAFSGGGTIDLGVGGLASSNAAGSGNISSIFNTEAGAEVEVCYFEASKNDVPEPGSLALFVPAVLGAGIVALRRRRK